MTKDEIINSIITNCNFEIISNLINAIIILKEKYDSDTFLEYLNIYKISKYKIAKDIALDKESTTSKNKINSQLDIEKIQMSKIGKIDSSTGYKRNPTSTQSKFLKNALYNLPEIKPLFTLTTAKEYNKIEFIIDFVNIHAGTNYDMLCLTGKDGKNSAKNMLSKCSSEDLTELLNTLESDNYDGYINEPEYDVYASFIDNTDINTLSFIYENLDTIVEHIEELYILVYNVIEQHSDKDIEMLTIGLKKRKSIKHEDKIKNLISFNHREDIIMDNEKDFRYHIFHNKFSKVDDYTSDKIIYIFKNMTSIKWDFIAQAFDKFKKPAREKNIAKYNKIIQ